MFHSHIISIFFNLSPNRTWNFVTKIFRYRSFPLVTGHGTEKVLLKKFEILEANKCKERAVTWKWSPLLVTGLHWSHHVDWKALVCFRIALGSCWVAIDLFFENEFLYKGRNNVTISQTWEFLFLVYLCPFVCNFAVKFIFVMSVLVIMFLIKSMVSISSTLVSPPKEKCV